MDLCKGMAVIAAASQSGSGINDLEMGEAKFSYSQLEVLLSFKKIVLEKEIVTNNLCLFMRQLAIV